MIAEYKSSDLPTCLHAKYYCITVDQSDNSPRRHCEIPRLFAAVFPMLSLWIPTSCILIMLLNTGVTPERFPRYFPDFRSIFRHFPNSCQIPWCFKVFQTSGQPGRQSDQWSIICYMKKQLTYQSNQCSLSFVHANCSLHVCCYQSSA